MSNAEAFATGNRRQALVQLCRTLAAALDSAAEGTLPGIASQYRSALAELDALPGTAGVSDREKAKAARHLRQVG